MMRKRSAERRRPSSNECEARTRVGRIPSRSFGATGRMAHPSRLNSRDRRRPSSNFVADWPTTRPRMLNSGRRGPRERRCVASGPMVRVWEEWGGEPNRVGEWRKCVEDVSRHCAAESPGEGENPCKRCEGFSMGTGRPQPKANHLNISQLLTGRCSSARFESAGAQLGCGRAVWEPDEACEEVNRASHIEGVRKRLLKHRLPILSLSPPPCGHLERPPPPPPRWAMDGE
jgi:hypothetical protein